MEKKKKKYTLKIPSSHIFDVSNFFFFFLVGGGFKKLQKQEVM